MKSESKLAGLGLLTSISASLCCITPVLALLSGTTGMASSFSWVDPLRPYLIALSLGVLGLAWFLKLRPKPKADCHCEPEGKPGFFHSKSFLVLVTLFALTMLSFPYYVRDIYPSSGSQQVPDESSVQTVEFTITGMTCAGCEAHINQEVTKLSGIIGASVSYEKGKAIIDFDTSRTTTAEIKKAIVATGYSVTD